MTIYFLSSRFNYNSNTAQYCIYEKQILRMYDISGMCVCGGQVAGSVGKYLGELVTELPSNISFPAVLGRELLCLDEASRIPNTTPLPHLLQHTNSMEKRKGLF
jgi:hypothetical protein